MYKKGLLIITCLLFAVLFISCEDTVEAPTYVVTFNANGGSGSMANQTFTYSQYQNLRTNAFAREGFNFIGWADNPAGEKLYNDRQNVKNLTKESSITLYAKWIQLFTVTFESNQGTGVPPQTIPSGSTVSRPVPDPTRNGFTFDNWYTTSALATAYNFSTPVTKDTILYAKWNSVGASQCTVKFITNSGTPIPDLSVPVGSKVTAQVTTREGYTFAGWYLDSDCTDSYNMDSAVTTDFTLYAKWTINKYTITFNINGGTGPVPPDTQDYNTVITLPMGSGLSRTGYSFLCWNTNSDGTGDDKNAGASYTIIGSETLFAKWKAITYKVVYHKNDDNAEGEMTDTVHTYDVPQNLTLNGYELPGFSFVEWTRNSNGTGDTFTNGKEVENLTAVQDAVVDLYAKWSTITHKITFDTNGGGSVPEQTVNHGGTATRPASNPTKSGYTFDDWYNVDLSTKYNFSAPVMSEITIYAKWGYTVTFNSNGGSAVASQLVYEGGSASRPITDPTRTGYTFDNWYTDTTFNAIYPFENQILSHTSVVARWIPAYTVNYDANGGEGDMEPTTHTVGIAKELSANTFTRTYYTFAGWATEATGSVAYEDRESVIDLRTSAGASITLYAKWTGNSYTISYLDVGGRTFSGEHGAENPTMHTYGTVTTLVSPTKTGYTFGGWFTDSGGTGSVLTSLSAMGYTANVTLHVRWIPEGMAWIPAGTFTMGSPASEPGRLGGETQHQVRLTKGFYMSNYQVTQGQWRAVMGASEDRATLSYGKGDNYPVYYVNWYDAIVFCNRLSISEDLTPAYRIPGYGNSIDPDYWIAQAGGIPTSSNPTWDAAQIVEGSTGYRLPTEAQWEYACRAGTTTAYNWGNDFIDDSKANYDASQVDANNLVAGINKNRTTEVGSYAANTWGLYDMHGNVSEWCWDWWRGSYSGTQTDPTGASSGTYRLLRGGYWADYGRYLRSAYGGYYVPSDRDCIIGFRILRPGE